MSFMQRYWRGELVRLNTWTQDLVFHRPFQLGGFAMPFPPGRYAVEFSEMEVAVRDRTVKQIVRCMVPIPPNLLPPGVRAMYKNVDHVELEQRHQEDRRPSPASLVPDRA